MSEWKTTACPLDCPCTCTMRARYESGRIEVQPHEANPWTRFLCGKGGMRWRTRALDPKRLRSPLLREGGELHEVTWERAWNVWASAVEKAVAEHGPLSLMFVCGAGSMYFSKTLVRLVFDELGGYTTTKGSLCTSVGGAGLRRGTMSEPPFVLPDDLVRANGVLLWGRNVWVTHPQFVPLLREMRGRGAEIASVDIRETETTRQSDRYWQVRPGTDWAVAAWLCKALLEDESRLMSADKRRLWREHALNADEFEKCVRSLDGGELLRVSGFTENDAKNMLGWLLSHAPVCHLPSYGAQRYLHGDEQFEWMLALAVMLGGFADPAAGLGVGKDEHALYPPSLTVKTENIRRFPVGCWGDHVSGCEPPIDVLMMMNGNPMRQNPGTQNIAAAMKKVPFKVCSELFMTETAQMCDLVLPACSFLEEGDDWIGSYWHNYVVRSEPVIPHYADCKTDVEIYAGLARALGLKTDLAEKMRELDSLVLSDARLRKADERVYFWDEPCYWREPASRVILPDGVPKMTMADESYPLRLITVRCSDYVNGQSDGVSYLPETPEIFLRSDAMRKFGVASGDVARVTSSTRGEMHMRVREDDTLPDGCAAAYQGRRGMNMFTQSLEAPGSGAPYAECFVSVSQK